MSSHPDQPINRNEQESNSLNNIDVDLTREQVPGRSNFFSDQQNNLSHLEVSDDKYTLALAAAPGAVSQVEDLHTVIKEGKLDKITIEDLHKLIKEDKLGKITEEDLDKIIDKIIKEDKFFDKNTKEDVAKISDVISRQAEPGIFEKPITAEFKEQLSQVFGNSYSELGRHHNQILDVDLKDIIKKQNINTNEPIILCNFDTHSDFHKYIPPEKGQSIGTWVDGMIAANPQITDFYWVMPDELKKNEKYRAHFFSGRGIGANLDDDPIDQTLFVNNDTQGFSWTKPSDYSPTKYRQVGIHKRTLEEMPDMKGKHVLWTTDLDGFDNTGWDTDADAKIPWQGQKGFEKYINTMAAKNIQPFFHFISQSTEYTTWDHTKELNRFAVEAGAVSLNGGDINITNHHNYGGDLDLKHPERSAQTGITTDREQDPEYKLLYNLFVNDARTTSPDGSVVLNKPNAEYEAAINEIIKARLQISGGRKAEPAMQMNKPPKIYNPRVKAQEVLRFLDEKDGKLDSVVTFRAIENDIISRAVRKRSK